MLGHYRILITYYLDSILLGFSVVKIYEIVIIRYQLILKIDVNGIYMPLWVV